MSESNLLNLIECKYGHHMVNKDNDFTPSGLNNECYSICRKCEAEKKRKYRQKYNDEYKMKQKRYEKMETR